MKSRQTIITFSVPAAFIVSATQRCNGRRVDYSADGRIAINGYETRAISRRGHVDPAVMRDLATAKGAGGAGELSVTWHEVDKNLRGYEVAKFIVNLDGPARPLRVHV